MVKAIFLVLLFFRIRAEYEILRPRSCFCQQVQSLTGPNFEVSIMTSRSTTHHFWSHKKNAAAEIAVCALIFEIFLFNLVRSSVCEAGMRPLLMIKLEISSQRRGQAGDGPVSVAIDLLGFQTGKEGLHRSTIVGDAGCGKGSNNFTTEKKAAKAGCGILSPFVAVEDQPFGRAA